MISSVSEYLIKELKKKVQYGSSSSFTKYLELTILTSFFAIFSFINNLIFLRRNLPESFFL